MTGRGLPGRSAEQLAFSEAGHLHLDVESIEHGPRQAGPWSSSWRAVQRHGPPSSPRSCRGRGSSLPRAKTTWVADHPSTASYTHDPFFERGPQASEDLRPVESDLVEKEHAAVGES